MTVTKLLDGSSIASINPAGSYYRLPQGDHEVEVVVHTGIGSAFKLLRTEQLGLEIVDRVTQKVMGNVPLQ